MEGRGFEYPKDTWMSKSGRIYVPSQSRDYGERGVRITILDIDSGFFGTFGHYGTDPGKLISPTSITANAEEELFICDDYGFIFGSLCNNRLLEDVGNSKLVQRPDSSLNLP